MFGYWNIYKELRLKCLPEINNMIGTCVTSLDTNVKSLIERSFELEFVSWNFYELR